MASKIPTMALSMKQAKAVADELGTDLPLKDNGWRLVNEYRLCRLPPKWRRGKNAQAYRLTAQTVESLRRFHALVNEHGKSACIVYKTIDEND